MNNNSKNSKTNNNSKNTNKRVNYNLMTINELKELINKNNVVSYYYFIKV